MRAIVVAAGQVPSNEDWQRWIRAGDLLIGADGGSAQVLSWGLVPDLVIGDLDSLPEADRAALEAKGCPFVKHPQAKDETDLELALAHAVKQGAEEIIILGALGGRLDHTLANVLLLTLPWLEGTTTRIVSGAEEVLLVQSGRVETIEGQPGDLVSLLPLGGDVQGVTTSGLAWALENEPLRFGFSRGVSNEMTASIAHVKVSRGTLAVVHGPAQRQGLVSD